MDDSASPPQLTESAVPLKKAITRGKLLPLCGRTLLTRVPAPRACLGCRKVRRLSTHDGGKAKLLLGQKQVHQPGQPSVPGAVVPASAGSFADPVRLSQRCTRFGTACEVIPSRRGAVSRSKRDQTVSSSIRRIGETLEAVGHSGRMNGIGR